MGQERNMRSKVALALLVLLLGLGTQLAGCASTSGGKNDTYDDQRRAEEMEWNLDPWR